MRLVHAMTLVLVYTTSFSGNSPATLHLGPREEKIFLLPSSILMFYLMSDTGIQMPQASPQTVLEGWGVQTMLPGEGPGACLLICSHLSIHLARSPSNTQRLVVVNLECQLEKCL